MFNLTMLISSFTSLVFCSNKKKRENNALIIYNIGCLQLVGGCYGGFDDRVNGNVKFVSSV